MSAEWAGNYEPSAKKDIAKNPILKRFFRSLSVAPVLLGLPMEMPPVTAYGLQAVPEDDKPPVKTTTLSDPITIEAAVRRSLIRSNAVVAAKNMLDTSSRPGQSPQAATVQQLPERQTTAVRGAMRNRGK